MRWCFRGPSSEWLRTTVFSLVLESDCLILESAIYWMVPGRPFNTRVPEERRGGRSRTTYERRLRASNQRNALVKGVRWIALKWRKQQKGRYPSCFHFPTDMARDTDVFSRPRFLYMVLVEGLGASRYCNTPISVKFPNSQTVDLPSYDPFGNAWWRWGRHRTRKTPM